MYLLDTNVVSELRKPARTARCWRGCRRDDTQLHLSAVTIGEIQAGIELTRQQDPPRRKRLKPGWTSSHHLERAAHGRASLSRLGAADAPQIRTR
jgi:predicted nucleic acid-binding protein